MEAYKLKKRQGKREVASAKLSIWEKWKKNSSEPQMKADLSRLTQQMKRDRQGVVRVKYVKDHRGEIKVEEKEI